MVINVLEDKIFSGTLAIIHSFLENVGNHLPD
jgi:hypothetical protein